MDPATSALRVASCADRALLVHGYDAESAAAELLHKYALSTRSVSATPAVAAPSTVEGLTWCADGSCLAAVARDSSKLVLTYSKNSVLTTTEIPVSLTSTNQSTPLTAAAFASTSVKRILLADARHRVALYDVQKRRAVKDFQCKKPVTCLAANANDSLFAAGCAAGGGLQVFSAVTHVLSPALHPGNRPSEGDVNCVRFSYGKKHLLGTSDDEGRMALWDCNSNSVLRCFTEHRAPCTAVTFSPLNDSFLISCGLDKRCVFYDLDAGKRLEADIRAPHPLTCAELLPDGKNLALGTSNGKVLLYDLRHLAQPKCVIDTGRTASVRAVTGQPTEQAAGARSLLLKGSRSKSKLFPRAQSSTSGLMKENVPAPALSPVVAQRINSEPTTSPQSTGGASTAHRDSFSSQIFSPLKEGSASSHPLSRQSSAVSVSSPAAALGASFNQSGFASGQRMSSDSVFSPLREHNVSAVGDTSKVNTSRGSYLRSPVDSFNRSINNPLVSPLVPINEEEMLATPEDEKHVEFDDLDRDAERREMSPPKLSGEAFVQNLRGNTDDVVNVEMTNGGMTSVENAAGPAGDSQTQLQKPSDLPDGREETSSTSSSTTMRPPCTTVSSTMGTFKESQLVASTPAQQQQQKQTDSKTSESSSHTLVPDDDLGESLSKREASRAVGEIRSALVAFPQAFLEARAAECVDAAVLNQEENQNREAVLLAGGEKLTKFQREYLSRCVEDAMEDHCHEMRMFMYKVQYDVVRSFQTQRDEMRELLKEYAVNEGLVREVEKLRRENEDLKRAGLMPM